MYTNADESGHIFGARATNGLTVILSLYSLNFCLQVGTCQVVKC